jgi:hypothetical protein
MPAATFKAPSKCNAPSGDINTAKKKLLNNNY